MMDRVKKFLSNYDNHNTVRNYKSAITAFFQSVYGEATQNQLDNLATKYFSEKRDPEEDVEAFLKHMNGQG